MVEQPQHEHDVEGPEPLRRAVEDVLLDVGHVRLEDAGGQREAGRVRRQVVHRDHLGAALLRLEREETVARSEIEHSLAYQRERQLEHLEDLPRVVDARRDDVGRELDAVVPVVVRRDRVERGPAAHRKRHGASLAGAPRRQDALGCT